MGLAQQLQSHGPKTFKLYGLPNIYIYSKAVLHYDNDHYHQNITVIRKKTN